MPRSFGGALIFLWCLSISLGSIEARDTAFVGRTAGGASLWGFRILMFGWEVAAVFLVDVGGSWLSSATRGVY